MANLRIEFLPVRTYGLGFFGFDHLQFTLELDPAFETGGTTNQDSWFLLEGTKDKTDGNGTILGANGANGVRSLRLENNASGDALTDIIGTPDDRGSRIIATGATAITYWNAMTAYARGIDQMALPYFAFSFQDEATPTLNSTSFAASVLKAVNIAIENVWPFGIGASPGYQTRIGSPDDDELATFNTNFNTLVGGSGNDTFFGKSTFVTIEKFYGGAGDDLFKWSPGFNLYHGGQPRMAYEADGFDTIDYIGVGVVYIESTGHAVQSKVADYIAKYDNGEDQLFSIESARYDKASDYIIAGKGVHLIETPLLLDTDENEQSGQGDIFGMSETSESLVFNAVSDTIMSVQTKANAGEDAGFWVKSVEWLEGSQGDDLIYVNSAIRGVEAGSGDDVLDARLTSAFSYQSPNGYDIELYGDDGDDTIVSSSGYTYADGGSGADTFVLSSMTSTDEDVIFFIHNSDANDKLFIPHNFFKVSRGEYEGSDLFQVSGAPFKFDDITNRSSFFSGPVDEDALQGNIEFSGYITYYLNGSDLLIELLQGHPVTETIDYGPGEPPGPTITYIVGEGATRTFIVVNDWSDGDLGIHFPLVWDNSVFNSYEDPWNEYPNLLATIADQTSASRFRNGLDPRPDAHLPAELRETVVSSLAMSRIANAPITSGTENDDIIEAFGTGPFNLEGFDGNDTITGSTAGDSIDGGTGADEMYGGRGNDTYYVDDVGDVVIENFKSGFDRVVSSINYSLGDNVEHLRLVGGATTGNGNALRNTLEGNELNNTLISGDGNDTLAGNEGDDTLIGGAGGDGYVYALGDGNDIIIDAADTSGAQDVLVLAGRLGSDDMNFLRDPGAFDDLIIRFNDGGRVTIKDYFLGGGAGIEGIEFANGNTWTAEVLAQHAEAARITNNDAPIANDDYFAIDTTLRLDVPLVALIANDRDPEGDALQLVSVFNVVGGTASINASGNVTIAPDSNGTSDAFSFDYIVSDGHGGTAQATCYLTLLRNAAPVITSSTMTAVVEDTPASGRIIATDPESSALTYSVATDGAPSKGVLSLNADGTFTYTPNANANGADRFVLAVSDGRNAPVEHAFEFTIASINDAPIVSGSISTAVTEDGDTITIDALQNAFDVDEATTLQVSSLPPTLPSGVVFNATKQSFTIDANSNAFQHLGLGATEIVSVSYAVSDGIEEVQTSLDVTVTGVNDAAIIGGAVTGLATEDMQTPTTGALTISDVDDGESLFTADTTATAYGTFAVTAAGAWTFALNNSSTAVQSLRADQALSDTATVTSKDGTSRSIAITIAGANDAAIIGGTTTGSVTEDATLTVSGTLTVSDVDSGEASFQAGTFAAVYGSLSLTTLGAWTYTLNNANTAVQALNAGQSLTDQVVVKSFDGTTKTIAITINGQNEASSGIIGTNNSDILFGTSAGETIDAKSGMDIVFAGGGDDRVIGGADSDVLSGDDGNDTFVATLNDGSDVLYGGSGNDTYDASAITTTVSVNLAVGTATGGQIGTDLIFAIENVIGGSGNDTINGSDSANTLSGGAGADTIRGLGGADRIAGNGGNDTLTGGAGSDTFVFTPGFGRDVITDFMVSGANRDMIEFQASLFANWNAVAAALSDSAAGAVITLNSSETITFTGVTKAALIANHVDDFRFV